MTGYGESLYGSDWYAASPYRMATEVYAGIRARIVKPVQDIPPVMDTLAVGLAQRVDWLQQGIQAFSLFNKIEYATGESDGFLPSLDDVWGRLYDLPRLTGEDDYDYRARLQTYVKVLTGSGTVPNCEAILSYLIGIPGGVTISSIWPARALIGFKDVDAMRQARARRTLLDSVLPGMFAAGVDYELIIPYIDSYITATVQGDAELPVTIQAALATDREITGGIDALVAYVRELYPGICAAVLAERLRSLPIRAAIRAEVEKPIMVQAAIQTEVELPITIQAAILTERSLSCGQLAAIQSEQELLCSYYAAIARNFEMQSSILALIVFMYETKSYVKAAVQIGQEISVGIKARIARSET
jgi:hypothetical protein